MRSAQQFAPGAVLATAGQPVSSILVIQTGAVAVEPGPQLGATIAQHLGHIITPPVAPVAGSGTDSTDDQQCVGMHFGVHALKATPDPVATHCCTVTATT